MARRVSIDRTGPVFRAIDCAAHSLEGCTAAHEASIHALMGLPRNSVGIVAAIMLAGGCAPRQAEPETPKCSGRDRLCQEREAEAASAKQGGPPPRLSCDTTAQCQAVLRDSEAYRARICGPVQRNTPDCADAEEHVRLARELVAEAKAEDAEDARRAQKASGPSDAEIEAFIAKHPKLSEKRKKALRKRTIVIGMAEDEVILIYGKPAEVNRTVGSFGTHEQWVYPVDDVKNEYFYFENGKLTAWQD